MGDLEAVVNIIVRSRTRLSLLMVRKREYPGSLWSGDVAFPGGLVRANEKRIDALIRETREETGLTEKDYELLALVAVDSPRVVPTMKVYAYLSVLVNGNAKTKPGSAEVAEVIWVPVEMLRGPVRLYHPFKKSIVEGYVYTRYIIWGLSRRLLDAALPAIRSIRPVEGTECANPGRRGASGTMDQ